MERSEKPLFYAFSDLCVDVQRRRLMRGSQQISLTPKVFDTLLIFLEHRGEVLEKDRLMNLLWTDSFVEESNLAQNVAVLRKALGENPTDHKFILTIPGRGYRFVAPVRDLFVEPSLPVSVPDDHDVVSRPEIDASSDTAVAPRNTYKWLYLALPAALLLLGAAAIWLLVYRKAADETGTVARASQITTSTGLATFPAVTANGNTVSFSSDRTGSFEIYVKQLVAGAREVQVTSDGGQNFQPAFSPDASVIAYHSKKRGGIWIVPVTGGTPRQVAEFGSNPAWSPDGALIAFQSHPMTDLGFNASSAMPPSILWIVSAKGGDPRPLTRAGDPPGGHGSPAFSPDGERIAFDASDFNGASVWSVSVRGEDVKKAADSAQDPVYSPDGRSIFTVSRGTASGFRALQRIDVDAAGNPTGEVSKLFDASGSMIRYPAIDASGRRMFYSSLSTASNIYSTDLGTPGEAVPLTQNANIRTLAPSFSPDGTKIAYQTFGSGIDSAVWVMDADGQNEMQLTTTQGLTPWWLPDGEHLSFRTFGPGGALTVWTMNLDGGAQKKIIDLGTNINYYRPSPDGKRGAFNLEADGAVNIWTIQVENGARKQLTFDTIAASFPAWSPDGKWIAYQLTRGDDSQIGLIPSDGGESIQLTSDKGQSWVYDWAPDNDRIVFAGQRDGIWNVYTVSRSTREVKKITNFTKINSYVRYPAWSPRDDRTAYEYSETTGNIWMIELK